MRASLTPDKVAEMATVDRLAADLATHLEASAVPIGAAYVRNAPSNAIQSIVTEMLRAHLGFQRDVLSDYIVARKSSALAPIAIRTVRDYRSVLENHVSRKSADIGRLPVHKLTGRDIRQWMDDLAADGVGVGTIANARRVLGAALAWEVREGRLGVNPATRVRIESSKARRAAMQTVDPVLLPSWSEFATLVETPEEEHDRLLIALLGWCGLRWSEGISLHEQAVWRDRPQITIDRVLVRRTQLEVDADTGLGLQLLENNYWLQEQPKAGIVSHRAGCCSGGRSSRRATPTALACSTTPTSAGTSGYPLGRRPAWLATSRCPVSTLGGT